MLVFILSIQINRLILNLTYVIIKIFTGNSIAGFYKISGFKIKSNPIYNLAAFFVGIQKIGGNVNSFLYKVDKNKCINCNKCVNTCPHNNIYIKNGKVMVSKKPLST